MRLAITRGRLSELLQTQIRSNFLLEESERDVLEASIEEALGRVQVCFSYNSNKYYKRDGEIYFNPYHSAQYCIFLYILARVIYTAANEPFLCDKLYGLNKMLNGLDLFYEVEMPAVFFTDHPVGSVMGRASYGNFFSFNQNCTVGNNRGIYPIIGENVRMYAGSRVLGNCQVGDNVIIASGAFVKDENIPSCSVVFGSSPHLVIKHFESSYFERK